jgi:hypothetical protein
MRLIKTLAAGVAASLLFAMPAMAQGAGGAAAPAGAPKSAGTAVTKSAAAPGSSAAPAAGAPAAAAPPAAGAPAAGTPAAGGAPGAAAPLAGTAAGAAGATVAGAGKPLAPAGPGAVAAAPTTAPAMDGPTYAVRLRDLEQRIDELKEQIRRSHTRLSLLSDTILSGGGAGSHANIKFKNELSSAFRVTRVLVVLDGAVQYNKTDQSGTLAEQAEIPIINGSVPPGDHTVQVLVNLQGNGYGVFSYLRGYRFEVRSSHSFTAVEGKTINLDTTVYEKGGVTTPLEERPAIRYVEKVASGIADATGAPAPAIASPGGAVAPAAPPP